MTIYSRRAALAGLAATGAALALPRGAQAQALRMPSGEELVAAAQLGGDVTYVVADAKTGLVLEARCADRPMAPASTAKTITSLYALETLGGGYRFATRLIATGPIAGGKVQGDLILAGGGDPTLDTDGLDDLAARLAAAGVSVEVSAEAASVMWTKFTVNCAFNAISAVARLPYGRIWPQPGVEALMRDVMGECVAVAAAEGIVLPETLWEVIHAVAVQMEGQFSSTAQDLMRGRPSEIDYLNGEIVRRAAALGLAAPANNALWVMVKLIEARLVEG